MSRLKSTAACPAAVPKTVKARAFNEKKERDILGDKIIWKGVNEGVTWEVIRGDFLSG